MIKTHGSVSCDPRKQAHTNRVSILTGITNLQFSCIHSSVMPGSNGTKFIGRHPPLRGGHIPNLKKTFLRYKQSNFLFIFSSYSSFHTLCKIAYACFNLATHIGGLKTNTSGVHLINIQGPIKKVELLSSLQGNCFEEQAENRYVARLNIRGVPFGE